jgi:hypothetical protein
MKETLLTCENCGNDFSSRRSDTKYCSNACRQDDYLKRRSEIYGDPRKAKRDPPKATVLVLLWVNELFLYMASEKISRGDLQMLLQKISSQDEMIFDNLPEHKKLIREVRNLCDELLKGMRANQIFDLETSLVKKSAANFLKYLKDKSRSMVTSVFSLQ